MRHGENAELACHLHRVVRARIVNQDDIIDNLKRDLAKCRFKRPPCIVGGQHNTNLLVCNHG